MQLGVVPEQHRVKGLRGVPPRVPLEQLAAAPVEVDVPATLPRS